MKPLPSFDKPLFIYDDRSKGCYGYVTDIIFKDDKCLLIDFKLFDFNDDYELRTPMKFEIYNEKFRAMVNLKDLVVYSSEVYDSYRLSNSADFLDPILENPIFQPPNCHFKQ